MKKIVETFGGLLIVFAVPSMAFASVEINEIAWMGSSASSYDEWIELKNTGTASVDLSGWTLKASDGSPNVSLSGSVPAAGFFLLERTDDDSAAGVSGDVIYTGGLSNGGEKLILSDASGNVKHTVSAANEWPAGDNDKKYTMQKHDGAWITAVSTPKAKNATEDLSVEDEEDSKEDETASSAESVEDSNASGKDEGSKISTHSNPAPMTDFEHEFTLVADAGRARAASVGSEVFFKGRAENDKGEALKRGHYVWNFGDGETEDGRKVSHRYDFPGEYDVVLNVEYKGKHAIDRTTISVSDFDINISDVQFGDHGFVEITNQGGQEINLSGVELDDGNERFVFPADTIIGAHRSLKFSNNVTEVGLNGTSSVKLIHAGEEVVFDFGEVKGASTSKDLSAADDIEDQLDKARKQLSGILVSMRTQPQKQDENFQNKRFQKVVQKETTKNTQKETTPVTSAKDTENNSPHLNNDTDSQTSSGTIVVKEPKSWWSSFLAFFF